MKKQGQFALAKYGDLIIKRKGNHFFISPVEDEALSRRLLNLILYKSGISIEELAFMHEVFKQNPTYTEAHFGVNGYFLFAK